MTEQPTVVLVDENDIRRYFTMIPHVIDDLGMTVYAVRLYYHIARVCGSAGGRCYQATATLAEHCKMSWASVSAAKAELVKNKLIKIEKRKRKQGGKALDVITLLDIWDRNTDHIRSMIANGGGPSPAISPDEIADDDLEPGAISPDEIGNGAANSHGEIASSDSEIAISSSEIKNNPLKKNPIKKSIVSPNGSTARIPASGGVVGDPNDEDSPYASQPASGRGIAVKPPSVEVEALSELLDVWRRCFPGKVQPKPGTHLAKFKTRYKNLEWRENWKAALEKAAGSKHLQREGWFKLDWIVRNDENIFKILDGTFDSFDRQILADQQRASGSKSHAPTVPIDTSGSVDWNLRRLERLQRQGQVRQ